MARVMNKSGRKCTVLEVRRPAGGTNCLYSSRKTNSWIGNRVKLERRFTMIIRRDLAQLESPRLTLSLQSSGRSILHVEVVRVHS
jgi:hypothetical protein